MRALKAAIFGVVLAVALTPVAAVAGPFEDGVAAYDNGDYATALRLLRPLAEQGHARAQYNLGFSYENGGGVPRDFVQAHMWFSLAASRFPPGEDRDRATQGRDTLALFMTPAQIAEAQKLARQWRPRGEQAE